MLICMKLTWFIVSNIQITINLFQQPMLDNWEGWQIIVILLILLPLIFLFRQSIKILYFDTYQLILKQRVEFKDRYDGDIKYVGGIDISFIKNDNINACISLAVLDLDTLETVFSRNEMIKMTCEYIPGYLAFRETPHIARILKTVKTQFPGFYPDVLIVDGNGRLHKKEFGLACQTGVTCDIPCIGVAKNLYQMEGCLRDDDHKSSIDKLESPGERFEIRNVKNVVIGCAVRTTAASTKPVYVSEGHRVSLETACEVVMKCSRYRVPEPVRLADIMSRDVLRQLEVSE